MLDAYGEQWLAALPRTYVPRREQAVDWATELRPFLNKPRAVEHATYLKALPAVIRGFVTTAERAERTARLQTLIDLFDAGHSVSVVAEAVRTALETRRVDTASLEVLAGYQRMMHAGPQPFAELHTPASVREWQPRLRAYDLLATGGEAHD